MDWTRSAFAGGIGCTMEGTRRGGADAGGAGTAVAEEQTLDDAEASGQTRNSGRIRGWHETDQGGSIDGGAAHSWTALDAPNFILFRCKK